MIRASMGLLALALACAPADPVVAVESTQDAALASAPPRSRTTEPGWVAVVLAAASVDVAPTAAGELAAVHVRPGDPVVEGQVLATLDDADARIEVAMANAKLQSLDSDCARAEIELAAAEKRVATERRLATSGIASTTALDDAVAAFERARVDRRKSQAMRAEQRTSVAQQRRGVDKTTIVAPFAGHVAKLHRAVGAKVGPTMPVLRLVDSDAPRVRFAVPPASARELGPGEALDVAVETIERTLEARVRRVEAELDPASHLVFVEADLVDADLDALGLRPGLAARVRRRATSSR